MREIHDHKVNECNEVLKIVVRDAPGSGGANHLYHIEGFNTGSNPSCPFTERYGKPADHTTILFQNGPIKENGTNGITQEVLIAICIDRLRSFQAGPFASADNQEALDHLVAAQECLFRRTRERLARGVEGTHQK